MIWESNRVASALGLTAEAEETFSSITTDTRALAPGALFVALRGERYDGHDYLAAAAAAGARGAVVRHGSERVPGLQFFEVDDTLVALGQLANVRRNGFSGPVVAVTGTNGKTSTKEMIRAVLSTRWKTHATVANRNNLVGVPLTILEAPADTEALVVEAGANAIGEIPRLRGIIEPSAAVVTNVSAGHLEGFGSEEAVLAEKTALLEDVDFAVTGIVPALLPERAREMVPHSCSAALTGPADVTPAAWSLGPDGCVRMSFRGHRVNLRIPGRHQGDNAMLALALGEALGVGAARMAEFLSGVVIPAGRGTVRQFGGLTVIDDTYNANPGSVIASLDLADSIRAGRPLVVGLGSMLELGAGSAAWHTRVACEVRDRHPHLVAVMGEFVEPFAQLEMPATQLISVADAETMGRAIAERLSGNELVLLKASRGMRLDKAIALITGTQGG